jgi:hypothetical protein
MPDIKNKSELLDLCLCGLPSNVPMSRFEIEEERDAIRFDWHGDRYRVTLGLLVERISNGLAETNEVTILMKRCLFLTSIHQETSRP